MTTSFLIAPGNVTVPSCVFLGPDDGDPGGKWRFNDSESFRQPMENIPHDNSRSFLPHARNTTTTFLAPAPNIHPPWHQSSTSTPNQPVPCGNTCASIAGQTLQAYPNYSNYDCGRVGVSQGSNLETANFHDLCTKAFTPQLSTCNISQLPASQAQTSLGRIWCHASTCGLTSLVFIPQLVSNYPLDEYSIGPNTTFVNGILNHGKLTDNQYFQWQEFLRRFGGPEELTRDAWFEEKLWISLDVSLYADIADDYLSLQDHHKGSISLLRLIINRIVRSE